jgi:predicted N-acetyltransferase YhbS
VVNTSCDYRLRIVDESAVHEQLRASVAALLAETLDDGPMYLVCAWRTLAPSARAIAFDSDGHVVGHAAAFCVPSRRPAEVYGLGDVAVAPRHRSRGVARRLCGLVTAACWQRGAAAIVAKTKPLRGVLGELGFVAVDESRFYYTDGGRRVAHPDWMAVAIPALPEPIELLHGDF